MRIVSDRKLSAKTSVLKHGEQPPSAYTWHYLVDVALQHRRELVHANLAQHAEIINATLRLDQDVNQILNDTVVPISKVLEDFERYIELQRTHMRNENTHLFPLAQRLLSEEDWRDVEAEYASHVDPMFALKQGKFASLFEYITEG